jgi:NACHT conflict system protein
MSVEAAALGVGKALAQLVAGRWMATRTARYEATTELVDLFKTSFPDQIMRRKTVRQFEAIADSVAERVMPLIQQAGCGFWIYLIPA